MDHSVTGRCPICQGELEAGHLGFVSGLLWSRKRPSRRPRFFLPTPNDERFVLGGWLSTPWFRTRPGHRCKECGALVLPTDR